MGGLTGLDLLPLSSPNLRGLDHLPSHILHLYLHRPARALQRRLQPARRLRGIPLRPPHHHASLLRQGTSHLEPPRRFPHPQRHISTPRPRR